MHVKWWCPKKSSQQPRLFQREVAEDKNSSLFLWWLFFLFLLFHLARWCIASSSARLSLPFLRHFFFPARFFFKYIFPFIHPQPLRKTGRAVGIETNMYGAFNTSFQSYAFKISNWKQLRSFLPGTLFSLFFVCYLCADQAWDSTANLPDLKSDVCEKEKEQAREELERLGVNAGFLSIIGRWRVDRFCLAWDPSADSIIHHEKACRPEHAQSVRVPRYLTPT